jgi:hypothetical protein
MIENLRPLFDKGEYLPSLSAAKDWFASNSKLRQKAFVPP